MNIKLALIFPFILSAPLMAQQFGQPLTLDKETKISDIIANVDDYDGKLVQVRGSIVDVCPKKGCYIYIKGDERYQSIMFKVEDRVITFPESIKGREVVAEGKVVKIIPDVTPACENEHADSPAKKVTIRIDGIGAVAK
jgi:hypothetical protein